MKDSQILQAVLFGAGAIIAALFWMRARFHKARFQGMQEAAHMMVVGASWSYEKPDEPIPDEVAKAVDETNKIIRSESSFDSKCTAYAPRLSLLAEAMGKAARKRGFDEGYAKAKGAPERGS